MKIEHIGIAVKNLASADKVFEKLFNRTAYKKEGVASEGVETSFYEVGDSKIELLEATSPDSAIAKFIERRGEGIHHIAFEVKDLEAEIERLTQEGFKMIHASPKDGADHKRIAFLHPKSTSGVLVELCQEKN